MAEHNTAQSASADGKAHDLQSTSGHHASGPFLGLAVGSVGVVYGDIGTSPLYALRESLHHASGDGVTRGEVIGETGDERGLGADDHQTDGMIAAEALDCGVIASTLQQTPARQLA